MKLSREQIMAMARVADLEIPEADLENVRLRLEAALTEMEEIERAIGSEMDRTDPVPPVYPHDDF